MSNEPKIEAQVAANAGEAAERLAAFREALSGSSRDLAAVAVELGLDDVAQTIETDTQRRLHEGNLRVVVLGEIKHGKSSLINALVGRKLLPVGVTPTTGALVRVRSGSSPGCYVAGKAIEESRFERLVRGDTGSHDGDGDADLELVCNPGTIPDAVELIDTPGFNDIAKFRSALSRAELPRADVLVLVLDGTQVLSRSELDLLGEAVAAVGGLTNSGASLELVINRIDLIADKDRPTLIDHIKTQLEGIVPPGTEPYLTDSRSALADPDREELGVTEVARLRRRLRELVAQREDILPARVRASLLRQARLLAYNAAIQARALTLEEETLKEEIAAVEEALAKAQEDAGKLRALIEEGCERVREASNDRLLEFRKQIEESARAQIHKSDLRSLTHVVPGAIQDAFLDFVHRESGRVRESLDELTRDVIHTHGEQARRRLYEATLHLGFRGPEVYVEPPSIVIEAGLIALGVAGTAVMYFGSTIPGLVMTVASPLVTVLLREKSVRDARTQTYVVLPRALDATTEAVQKAVATVVEHHGRALEEHIALADRALGEQLLATLRQAQRRLTPPPGEAETPAAETESDPDPVPETDAEPEKAANSGGTPESAQEPAAPAHVAPVVQPHVVQARHALSVLEHRLEAITYALEAMSAEAPKVVRE